MHVQVVEDFMMAMAYVVPSSVPIFTCILNGTISPSTQFNYINNLYTQWIIWGQPPNYKAYSMIQAFAVSSLALS